MISLRNNQGSMPPWEQPRSSYRIVQERAVHRATSAPKYKRACSLGAAGQRSSADLGAVACEDMGRLSQHFPSQSALDSKICDDEAIPWVRTPGIKQVPGCSALHAATVECLHLEFPANP